jgi:hypothetical protein
MLVIPPEFNHLYATRLAQKSVAVERRPHYHKWLRYYLDFCHKYGFEPTDQQSFPAFHEKRRAKNQSAFQRKQAYHAVTIYYETVISNQDTQQPPQGTAAKIAENSPLAHALPRETAVPSPRPPAPLKAPSRQDSEAVDCAPGATEGPVHAFSQDDKTDSTGFQVTGASWVSVYDRLTSAIKVRHYSPRTLLTYKIWTQKFQTFTKSTVAWILLGLT